MTTPANPDGWTVESGTSTDLPAAGAFQTPVTPYRLVELPVTVPYAMVRVRVRGGHVVAKSWRPGRGEQRGGWRSMRSERLSRIRRQYRERRR